MNLRIDPERMHRITSHTGMYVRAQHANGTWASADIAHLTRESLIEWLASRDVEDCDGDGKRWRDSVVLNLLGYERA